MDYYEKSYRYKDTEKIVKFLLDKEADVNAQNDERGTPLHLILQKIDLDIDTDKFYTLLNKKGINVNLIPIFVIGKTNGTRYKFA